MIEKKVPKTSKYFFMFMMFMWVSSVSVLTSFNFSKNPILMPIYILIIAYYYIKYCHKSYKPIIVFLSIFLIWNICSILKFGGYIGTSFPPIYSIIIAHVAFNIYTKKEFINIFEDILVKLCILSLFVWLCANIVGTPFVNFMKAVSVIEPSPPTESYSFLVGLGSQFEMGIRRNIGFTWEPGRFSCWILLGIFLNLVRNNFVFLSIRKNVNFSILLITLLTTMSTTGYSGLIIIIVFIILNKRSLSSKLFLILSCALLFPVILSLSFMTDKIVSLMDMEQGMSSIEYHYSHDGMDIVCPQRFTGFYLSIMNFIHDFWLGYNQLSYSYATTVLFNNLVIVAPSEGIIYMMAKYGIFVGLFFYYWLLKSSKFLSETLHYKGYYIFFIFFIVISFSYEFWENCIFMYLYLSAFYKKYDSNYN